LAADPAAAASAAEPEPEAIERDGQAISGTGCAADQPSADVASLGLVPVTQVGIDLDRKLAALLDALEVPASELGGPAVNTGTSRSVISWVKRLTKTERLRKSMSTAATGRRAVEHPPQSGSIGEGDSPSRSSMSQAIFQHRVAGGRGCHGEACP
jgi:hypothetical protein